MNAWLSYSQEEVEKHAKALWGEKARVSFDAIDDYSIDFGTEVPRGSVHWFGGIFFDDGAVDGMKWGVRIWHYDPGNSGGPPENATPPDVWDETKAHAVSYWYALRVLAIEMEKARIDTIIENINVADMERAERVALSYYDNQDEVDRCRHSGYEGKAMCGHCGGMLEVKHG